MPVTARWRARTTERAELGPLRRVAADLGRVELVDRSVALGAQALIAVVPLLIVIGQSLPEEWRAELLTQIRDVLGVRREDLEPVRDAVVPAGAELETGLVSLLVALLSASAFGRSLQRMLARVWEHRGPRGARAYRTSMLWIAGWLVALQLSYLLAHTVTDELPWDRLLTPVVQVTLGFLLWWWTAWFLLAGQVPWRRLLAGAVLTAGLLVVYQRLASLFMAAFVRANLEQYGALGVVFSVSTWLIGFGAVLVVSNVVGRAVTEWFLARSTSAGTAPA